MYRSPNLQGTPFLTENAESDIFDGLQIQFSNHWVVKDSAITWVGKNAYVVNIGPTNLTLLDPPLIGYARPADYEMQFANTVVDTSTPGPFPYDVPIPTKFRIFNRTEGRYIEFYYVKGGIKDPSMIEPLDEVILAEPNPRGQLGPTWDLFFLAKPGEPGDTLYNLGNNDRLVITMFKPFRNGDVFDLETTLPSVDQAVAKSTLDDIRVVPNPYVTAAAFEPPLNPGITSGRGERKIDFTNLPAGCTDPDLHLPGGPRGHAAARRVDQQRDGLLEPEEQGEPGRRLRRLLLCGRVVGRHQDRQDSHHQVSGRPCTRLL